MNIKTAVFGLVSIKPQSINAVVNRLPYSKKSIYNAVESMLDEKNLIKAKIDGELKLDVPKDYESQKRKEFFIKALSCGVDPAAVLRDTPLKIWNAIGKQKSNTVSVLSKKTGLSEKTVREIIHLFLEYELVFLCKGKPIVVEKNNKHPLYGLLNAMLDSKDTLEPIYVAGSSPFSQIVASSDEMERILYDKIDGSLAVKKTGFLVRGKDERIAVLESTLGYLSLEEVFLKKIFSVEGVEEACIVLLASGRIEYDYLLRLCLKKGCVNAVGCYLDIVKNLKDELVPESVVETFLANVSKQKSTFLKAEKKYGKAGWEGRYEKKWNVDLYLDIGSVMHGVRSV